MRLWNLFSKCLVWLMAMEVIKEGFFSFCLLLSLVLNSWTFSSTSSIVLSELLLCSLSWDLGMRLRLPLFSGLFSLR